MKPPHTWKDVETRIARIFGTERTPLSGSGSKHTASDTLHPEYYIEIKHSGKTGARGDKQISIKKEWLDEIRENMEKEKKKLGFLVAHFKGCERNYVILDMDDFLRLLNSSEDAAQRLEAKEEVKNFIIKQVEKRAEDAEEERDTLRERVLEQRTLC